MPPKDRAWNSSRRRPTPTLAVEGLEGRALMTVIVHHARTAPFQFTNPMDPTAVPAGITPSDTPVTTLPSNQNASVLGPPTSAERAKQWFAGKFAGSFMTAPGRYVGEPLQAEVLATGGSNQSLTLTVQMQFFLYSDPNAVPTGQIALTPKNTGSTGTILVLDLTSDGTSFSHNLPTHYTWTVNGNACSGLYTEATGSGTLDISYRYSKAPRGVRGRGSSAIVITGSIVTNHGLALNTAAPGSRTKNP